MGYLAYVLMTVLMCTGLLMIFIVLLQRGRGGGLAGAFGGMGGQSAFGTKAGDVFTKITVVIAVAWVVLAAISGLVVRAASEQTRDDDFQQDTVPTMRGAEGGEGEGDVPPVEPISPPPSDGGAEEEGNTGTGDDEPKDPEPNDEGTSQQQVEPPEKGAEPGDGETNASPEKPETTDPESTDPESTDPGTTDPGTKKPADDSETTPSE